MPNGTKTDEIINARLERLLKASSSKNPSELANFLNITPQSISGALKRGKIPGDWIEEVAVRCNISADWLLFGEESKSLPDKDISNEGDENRMHYIQIPLVETELSAGGGSLQDSSQVIKKIEINPEIIKYKGSMKDMVFMTVYGDSMEPTIAHKDLVLINLSQTTPYSGGVFAVAHDYGVYMKRLTTEPGKLILRSDNKFYDDIVIDLRDEAAMDLVKIIGRAIWWCHDERL